MTANGQQRTLFVVRCSSFVVRRSIKAKNTKTANGRIATTVFCFFTNDE